MKYKIFLASLILSMMSGVTYAGLMDMMKMPGSTGTQSQGSGNVEQDVNDFLKTASDANNLVVKSSDVLFNAVAKKEEIEANDRAVKATDAIADPKEKEAALKKAHDDQQVILAKVDYDAKAAEMGKGMDSQKQTLIAASIYDFILGMLKDQQLMDRGNNLISSASSNPMMISKLIPVKDSVSSISSQLVTMPKIASGIQKLSSVVKLEKIPTSASDTPKPISGD